MLTRLKPWVIIIGFALAISGCRTDLSDGKYPKLVRVSKTAVIKTADRILGRQLTEAKSVDVKLGAADFADKTLIDTYKTACRKIQGGLPKKVTGSETMGRIWEGKEKEMDPIPPPKDDVFLWIEGDAEYLDPNLVHESAGNAIASQLFEALLIPAPGNTPPVPGSAERYEVSKDGKTYTFYIRKGLKWSDGKPLNAHDFRYSWLRGLNPKTGSQNAQLIWTYIKGGKAYSTGKNKDPNSVAIKVLDDHTLQVELKAPAAFFPSLLTYIAYAPVPKHAIEKHGKQWTRPKNIVVNGAFTMTEWKPRDRVVFVKNESYWDAKSVKIKKSIARLSNSETANMAFYQTGQAYLAKPLPVDELKKWIRAGRTDLKIDQQMCTYYYVFRTDRPPFNNRLVRQAFNMAIDKELLTTQVLSSMQKPATHLLPNMFYGMMGYKGVDGDGYNPEGAERLLTQAGFPGGQGISKLELIYNTFESHRRIAVFVQRAIAEHLGPEISVNNMEWKSLLKKVHGGDFQYARTSWCADYPDPLTFLEVFHTDSENNYSAYRNPAYDKVLDDIKTTTDPKERNTLICAAEKTLNRDLPISPLYFYTRSYLLRPFIKGYEAQYQDHHLLKYISIKR
jgi:oligopeptide transport system substrate-binding protein